MARRRNSSSQIVPSYSSKNVAYPSNQSGLLVTRGNLVPFRVCSLFIHSLRAQMYSLFCLLHHAKVLQQSTYIRNMLMLLGLLTVPPHQSLETPSFRIIDFGRRRWPDISMTKTTCGMKRTKRGGS